MRKEHIRRWGAASLALALLLAVFSPGPRADANDVAREDIMNVNAVWDDLELYGDGQIVAVADTGLDSGDLDTLSEDFAGRVVATYALGRSGDWSDANGHGTHVAGSVLGSGAASGSEPDRQRYDGSLAGVAPQAELVFQSLLDADGGLGGLPDDLGDLFQEAYDAGARVHTNSWGANFFIPPIARFLTSGAYTASSVQTDRFLWEHRDMVVLFAAGNEGNDVFPVPDGVVDEDSLGSPGTAKNVITVGASENLRSTGGDSETPWGERSLEGVLLGFTPIMPPLAEDYPSDDADGMAVFSSRGPTNDGRIKPDVVAPGTNVLSVHSAHPDAVELYGLYEKNEAYAYCSGTSMATPLVAGAVALIRQWYVDERDTPDPSAALIKATLINGAADTSPGQYGTGPEQEVPDAWPNPVIGWGRVDLAGSIAPDGRREIWFDDSESVAEDGDAVTFTRYAGQSNEPLRVTLVWTDPAGEEEPEGLDISVLTGERAPSVLVNDLDLEVTAPDGEVYLGNGERAEADGADRLNNVEAVRIPNPSEGEYRIVVRAHRVAQGPQPFAVVLAGDHVWQGKDPTPTPTEPPEDGETRPGDEDAGDADAGDADAGDADAGDDGAADDGGTSGDGVDRLLIYLLIGAAVVIIALLAALVIVLARRSSPSRAPSPGAPSGGGGYAPPPPAPSSAPAALAPTPAAIRTHALVVRQGAQAGQRFGLSRDVIALGRSSQNDIALRDERASRHHARIERRGDSFYVYDLNSANGTFVNGQRITSQQLRPGDELRIGRTTLVLVAD